MTPRDVAVASAIAIIFILALVSHKWRLAPADVVGYWRPTLHGDATGGEYQINAGLVAHGRPDAHAPVGSGPVEVRFPRRVCFGRRCGSLDLSGRHLSWGGGERWIREGVFACGSCV